MDSKPETEGMRDFVKRTIALMRKRIGEGRGVDSSWADEQEADVRRLEQALRAGDAVAVAYYMVWLFPLYEIRIQPGGNLFHDRLTDAQHKSQMPKLSKQARAIAMRHKTVQR
jgi:hypothetical protein